MKVVKSEEEWFAKFEIQMIRDAKRKRTTTKDSNAEKQKKPSNYMLCPKDGSRLKAEKIGNIEVDICQACNGIWLDKGELEDIVLAEKSKRKNIFRKLLGFEK